MMQHWLEAEVAGAEARGDAARSVLRTADDVRVYQRSVAEKVRRCFGPLPERTPLNARTTATHRRNGYTIENVVFDVRPGMLLTGNLYLPQGLSGPAPAVLGVCGHSGVGKAAEAYQSFAQGLAKQGYVVFLFDALGMGERSQYVAADGKLHLGRSTVNEHLLSGNQQFLVGENLSAWFLWDAIRGLDYLLSRPEVDARHVGVTGNSGGGMSTTWLAAVDSRITMAAPGCFITTLRRNAENEEATDTEQCPPGALAEGLDLSDFLVPLAPKPVILLGKEKDFFDIRGFDTSFARLQQIYRLLGAEENVQRFVGEGPHGYSQDNREAMYRFFNKITGRPGEGTEPKIELESEKTLRCFASGQVALEGSRSVFSFSQEKSRALLAARPAVTTGELPAMVRRVLALRPEPAEPPDFRVLRPMFVRRYARRTASVYAVRTEPHIEALVYRNSEETIYSRPPRGSGTAILYVSHVSADDELRNEPLVKKVSAEQPDVPLFTCDLRGIGESLPGTCRVTASIHDPYGPDYFYAIQSVMLRRSYVAQRTDDLLRVLQWLEAHGHPQVHLVARGWGALPATFAAVVSGRVSRITLKHALTSYASAAETELYKWPLSGFVPDILRHFDLPDCYAALAAKQLTLLEPRNAAEAV
jgi:dienelactone hydrolase